MTEVIATAKDHGVFDGKTATVLTTKLKKETVGSIGDTKFALTQKLKGVPDAFKLAGELLDFMRQAELIGLPTGGAVAPTTVNVVTPTQRSDMGLAQLFAELGEHPEDADELTELIERHPTVVKANRKLHGTGEWAVTDKTESLNVDETLAYIGHLAKEHTQPQRKWKGQYWPTTLKRALGRDSRPMLYPFALDQSEILLEGPDRFGNDWARLPELVHETLLDAIYSKKLAYSGEAEVRRLLSEIFGDQLPQYLQDMVDEYEQRKARGEKTQITRYATPADIEYLRSGRAPSGSRLPFGSEPVRDDAWYERQLREVADRAVDRSGGNEHISCAVIPSLRMSGGNLHLDRVICLGNVTVTGGNVSGTGWTPRSASVHNTGGHLSREVTKPLSWKQLYEKAVELGILERA